MARLGFIGLSTMCGQMVARLLAKGHAVTGYNRTQSKARWLVNKGMTLVRTPRDVAEASDVVFAMVTNGAALPGFDTYQGGPSELGQGAWTHIFTSNLVNEFRASETRISFMFAPLASTVSNRFV